MAKPIFNTSVNATFEHNTVGEAVKDATALYIGVAAVISRIEINGDTVTNVVANYIGTPANAVGAGAYLLAGFDNYFSAVTLTSGNVTMVLRNT